MTVLTYQTLAAPCYAELKDKGSKFMAFAYPISSSDEVKALLEPLKKEHFKAVHFCYAYRLGPDGSDFRANDDGEPSGSAGRPILGQIDSAELTDVVVIVVRYFGGTLLGVPGLIQAYKGATALALAEGTVLLKNVTHHTLLSFEYATMNDVMRLIKTHEVVILSQEMTYDCQLKVSVPLAHKDAFLSAITHLRTVKINPITSECTPE
ncbi:MAG: YigZ family protein [Neisseriaceae bacterium]|nr:YigZ family protein [Neisseriaceae bacterium]